LLPSHDADMGLFKYFPLALTPIPSHLIFRAKDTTHAGVLSLDIGVPVLSLNLLPHPLHK